MHRDLFDALAAPALLQSFSLLLQRWATSHTQELRAYVSRAMSKGRMPRLHGQVYEHEESAVHA